LHITIATTLVYRSEMELQLCWIVAAALCIHMAPLTLSQDCASMFLEFNQTCQFIW